MPTLKKYAPWLRAVLILSAVGVIVGRVTFAALQSQQAILAGNTIESATAALQLSTDGGTFASSQQGFTFSGLVPGGQAMPSQNGGKPLWFKNTGNATLTIKGMISTAPNVTGDIDLSKVYILLTPTGGTTQTISVAALQAAANNGGMTLNVPEIAPGVLAEYHIQVRMAEDAFSGNSATIQNLSLIFVGGASVPAQA